MLFERIKRLREEEELKQYQVAEAINISYRSYSYYETGQHMVPPWVLARLAYFYGVSVDYLLGLTDEAKPYPYNPTQTEGFAKLAREDKPL